MLLASTPLFSPSVIWIGAFVALALVLALVVGIAKFRASS